jgi:hypothetical protein
VAGVVGAISRARTDFPDVFDLVLAALAGAGTTVFIWLLGDTELLAMRGLYAAALVCLSFDALETANLGAGPRRWSNPDRWVMAGFHAVYLTAFLTLFMWEGSAQFGNTVYSALFGGLIYGFLTAFTTWSRPSARDNGARYDLSRPITDRPFAGLLYRLWPLIVLALFLGYAGDPPDAGWADNQFLQIVLLSTLMVRYPPARKMAVWRGPVLHRLVGAGLLLVGLFITE